MIWRATAQLVIGWMTLDQTLTFDAPAFPAAVTKATDTFPTDAYTITSVAHATCGAFPADEATCGVPATGTDGYCDDCREWATARYIAAEERP